MSRYLQLVVAMIFLYSASSPGQISQQAISNSTPSHSPLSFDSQQKKETWTVLSLNKSGINSSLIKGVVFGKSEGPEFISEVVRVQWRPGDPIDLYVVRPRGVAKPPVILYLYDYLSDTDRFRNDAWCREVTKHGFAAVGFVSALTGQRYHGRPMVEWFISEMQESLGASTHDVQMIINYLASRGDIDTAKVGMLGENSGGTIAILAAATDPRIAFVDAINPWGDWPDWLKESRVVPKDERADYLKPEFLQKVAMLDPVKYLPQLSPGRIRIEQVASDPMTPQSVQAKIAASASAPSVVMDYPDIHTQVHAWMTQNWWLKDNLQPSAKSPATADVKHDTQSSGH